MATSTTGARALRGGVIGCGFFAANHLNAWREIDGVEIVAVCDRDPTRAEQARARFSVPRAYSDAADMIAAEPLDFVDVVTTVETHRALVELCAKHRVPVICQKPFALDLADARAMVERCREADVPLMVHENFRWQVPMLAVRKALDEGTVGRPSFARISFRHRFDIYANQPYLATEKRLALVDVGVHVFDLARFFLGEVTRLYCRNRRLNPRVAGEDSATLLLDHADDAVSIVDIGFYSRLDPDPFPQTLVHIEGDRGTLSLDAGYRLTVIGPQGCDVHDVEPEVPRWGEKPWHAVQDSVRSTQAHWIDCLRSGAEPRPSGADNLRTLDLVFKAYDSAASGQAIAIPT